jgi:hypothetical protein
MAVLPIIRADKAFSTQTLYRWRHCLRQHGVWQASTKTVFTQVISTALPGSSLTLAVGDTKLTFSRLPDPQWLAHFLSLSHSARCGQMPGFHGFCLWYS